MSSSFLSYVLQNIKYMDFLDQYIKALSEIKSIGYAGADNPAIDNPAIDSATNDGGPIDGAGEIPIETSRPSTGESEKPPVAEVAPSAPPIVASPPAPPSSANAVHIVSSAEQLQNVLKIVQAGDVIKLAAGDYGNLVLNKANFASDIKITSLDADHPATFNTIKVMGSSGIVFDGVDVKFTPDANTVAWSNAVYIFESSGISFVNSELSGGAAVNGVPVSATTLDSTQNVLGMPAGQAVFVFKSSNVTISGNDINTFHKGIIMADVNNIDIYNNDIYDLRTTPISGSNVSYVTIYENHLHDSNPWNYSAAGDHGDYIHLWTNPKQQEASEGIIIKNNFMDQGSGAALLGIYLDDDKNGIGFVGIDIQDNVIINNESQAIRLENVAGNVSGNTMTRLSSDYASANPGIIAVDGSKIIINENVLSKIYFDSTSNISQSGNVITKNGVIALDYVWSIDKVLTSGSALRGEIQQAAHAVTDLDFAAIERVGTELGEVLNDRGVYSNLSGKGGNDQYVVDNPHTQVFEDANEGIDSVSVSFNFTLSANVENLTLRGPAIIGTGNDLDNQMRGNAADNILDGRGGNDVILGGDGNDIIHGGDGNDRLHGEGGNDTLYGDAGDDWLSGYAGDDVLIGGDGADQLYGGPGNDTLTGGAGADRFCFGKSDFADGPTIDWITDFSRAEGDKVDLMAVDAKVSTVADDRFTFLGTAAFTGHEGELRYEFAGGDTYIYGDTNGDRIADIVIGFHGNIPIVVTDIVL